MTYCPDCNAEVVHQKIPEDCSHCECDDGWNGDEGMPCLCACHDFCDHGVPMNETCQRCMNRED